MCGRILTLFNVIYDLFVYDKPLIDYNFNESHTPPGTPPPSRSPSTHSSTPPSSRYNLRARKVVSYDDSSDPDSRDVSSNDE